MAVSTFDLRMGGTEVLPPPYAGGMTCLRKRLDFTKWRDWARDVETDSPKASDIIKLFNIPAGTFVWRVGVHVEVAGTMTDFDIGDATAKDTYIDGATTATVHFDDSTDQEGDGVFHDDADVIDLEINAGDPTTDVITVTVYCLGYQADG